MEAQSTKVADVNCLLSVPGVPVPTSTKPTPAASGIRSSSCHRGGDLLLHTGQTHEVRKAGSSGGAGSRWKEKNQSQSTSAPRMCSGAMPVVFRMRQNQFDGFEYTWPVALH